MCLRRILLFNILAIVRKLSLWFVDFHDNKNYTAFTSVLNFDNYLQHNLVTKLVIIHNLNPYFCGKFHDVIDTLNNFQ